MVCLADPINVGFGEALLGMESDPRMNPISLRFPPEWEAKFQDDYADRSISQTRMALLLGFLMYAFAGIFDAWIIPEVRYFAWFLRYAIGCPLIAAVLALSYHPYFKRYSPQLLSFAGTATALGIIGMIVSAQPANGSLYYAGLMIVTIFVYAFIRVNIFLAVGTSLVILVAYLVLTQIVSPVPTSTLVNNIVFLVEANSVLALANYSMQFLIRKSYWQKQVIESRTKAVEDKNEELLAKNRELAESQAELVRSVKRTELVFAALSDALPGTVLDDKYRLEEKIGLGGFGTVYRATHLMLKTEVAVKVFRPSFGSDPIKNLERFRVEGVSASRVKHPNAINIIDFGVSASSIAYMVMELLEGLTLEQELKANRELSIERTARILVPVCNALADAHASGIIHRDIKPSNIFLQRTKEGENVKVVDFGIAKLVSDTLNPDLMSLTETGALLGTPTYMSPERLSNKPYDGQADVYSVGVMMYQMLCGQVPFESSKENYWYVVLMHMSNTAAPPRQINPSIPEDLEALIMRCLAKEPSERPTAMELADLLGPFIGSEPPSSNATANDLIRQTAQPAVTLKALATEELVPDDLLETIAVRESDRAATAEKAGSAPTPTERFTTK